MTCYDWKQTNTKLKGICSLLIAEAEANVHCFCAEANVHCFCADSNVALHDPHLVIAFQLPPRTTCLNNAIDACLEQHVSKPVDCDQSNTSCSLARPLLFESFKRVKVLDFV